jgi:hypothetical protein
VRLVGTDEPLKWRRDNEGLEVRLDSAPEGGHGYALALELE